MAKQTGLIRLSGTLAHLSFYTRLGKEVVRVPGGPTAEQIRTRKSCKRNRENIDEFYHGAVRAAKTFRVSLAQLKHMWHPDISGKLNKLFRQVIELSPGMRGQRPVRALAHKEILKSFMFHPDVCFDNIATLPITIDISADRNSLIWKIANLDCRNNIRYTKAASHFRLYFAISVLSEYVFIKSGESYQASDLLADGLSNIVKTGYMSVNESNIDLIIETSLPGDVIPHTSSAVIMSVGIEFNQEVNGEMYALKEGRCMKIWGVG